MLYLHHDHLICTRCGKIVEFSNEEIERLQAKVASDYEFYMLQHRMWYLFCMYETETTPYSTGNGKIRRKAEDTEDYWGKDGLWAAVRVGIAPRRQHRDHKITVV